MTLLYIFWDVKPQILTLGDLQVRWYGVLFASAFLAGYYIFQRFFKKEGLAIEILDSLTIYMVIGVVLGARLGHCLFYQPDYYLVNPLEILMIWHGGLASHGAAIGILLGMYLFARKHKIHYLWILDRIVIVVALSGFFIRMGNLMNSEIYGHQTSLPWGFIFAQNNETVPKHPTQIYEALIYLAIFILLYTIYYKKDTKFYSGSLFGWFLVLLFTARFLIEYIKETQVEFEANMSLNMGQILSIPFIIAGLLFLYISYKKKIILNPRK